jgi:hypothetical protein
VKKAIFILSLIVLCFSKPIICLGQTAVTPTDSSRDDVKIYIDGVAIKASDIGSLDPELLEGIEEIKTVARATYGPQNGSIIEVEDDSKDATPLVDWDELYHQKYIGVGILGVLKYPGVEVNYSFPHKYFIKEKMKKGAEKRINKVRRWDIFVRYYWHKNFHHNFMLTGGRTWQRELKKNKFFISQADVGVARTMYTNPTFSIENGVVKRNYFDGDLYATFNYRLGFGKHFQHKNETYRFYSYFGVMNYAPFNNLYYSRLVIGLNVNKFISKK